MRPIFQILICLFLIPTLAAPALAEGMLDGQPYFQGSAMVAGARNSRIDDSTGSPDPTFTTGAEVVTNVGYGLSLSLGWLFDSNWRTELELSRRAVALDNIVGPSGGASLRGNLTVHTAFLNILKDFRGKKWITPYVGLGVGYGIHELDIESIDGAVGPSKRTPTTMAFQGMFGVQLEVGDDVDVVVGYRYVNYYAPDYTQFSYDFVDVHNFEMGLKFYFEDW